jgi:EmrB/QacA subfamily drug resistance transporter
MSLLDSTIVNVALPNILKDFHASLDQGQLVLTVYLLALAIVIPLSGFLGERVGMKRLYIITLALFTIGSALCGLAWDLNSLIIFRILQGLGGGMVQPLGMAIVFTMITPLERGRFMTVLGLPLLLAPVLGPTVGGLLVEYSTWRMIFLVNVPIGILNIILAMALLKETPIRPEARLDKTGLALAALGFPGTLLGLSLIETDGGSPLVLLCLVGGAIALVAFIVYEYRKPEPLLQMRLFKNHIFAIAMGLVFITQFSLFGIQYLLPILLQNAYHLSPAQTGVILFPSGIASFISMNWSGRNYNTIGPRKLAIAGLAVTVVSTFLMGRMTEDTSLWLITLLASSRGIAIGLCIMPVQTAAYNTVAQSDIPRATAMTNVLFRVFGSATTAILTILLAISLSHHGGAPGASVTDADISAQVLVRTFNDAFLGMTLISAFGFILAAFLRDDVIEALRRGEVRESATHLEFEA